MAAPWVLLLLAGALTADAQDEPEEVVVEVDAPDGPPGATVIPVDARWSASADLGDVLDAAAGASVRRLGGLGAWTGVSLRGSAFRQVQVHLDGVPLNPDGVDAVNLAELPLAALAEVRVFRGRAPAVYGASPVGGVVDLVSRDGSAPAVLRTGLGSFGSWRLSGAAGGEGRLGRAPTDASLAADAFGTDGRFGWWDDGGTPFDPSDDAEAVRTGNDRLQVAGHGRWRVGDAALRWTLLDAVVWRDEGLPGPVGAPTPGTRLRTVRNLAVSSWEGTAGAARPGGRIWHLVRDETLEDGGAEHHVFHTAGAHVQVEAAARDWLAVGASASGRGEVHTQDGQAALARSRGVVGAAAEVAFSPLAGRLRVVPQVDARVLVADDVVAAVVPGLVVEGRPGDGVLLRLTGGGGFRPPDLTELYGNRGALVGNAALRPERSWSLDAGLAWQGGDGLVQGSVEGAGFARWTLDRITWIQNAQRTVLPVNLAAARVAGVELAGGLSVGPWVEAHGALTWTHSENLDTDPSSAGRPLPFVPAWEVDQRLLVGWGERVRVGWTFHLTAGTAVDVAAVRWQAARPLHGLLARATPWRRGPTLEVEVRNLADLRTAEVPRDPLSTDPTTVPQPLTDWVGYPLPGRTLWVSLSWRPGAED